MVDRKMISDLLYVLRGGKLNRDGFKIHGRMEMHLIKPDGTVESRRKDNIIVTSGFVFVADAIGNSGARPAVMSHIALGTTNTAPAIGQTALVAELYRKAATFSKPSATQFQYDVAFNPGEATGVLVEAGLLNDATTGILFDRVIFAALTKAVGDTLVQRFIFTMS